jgi:hypothetical protein
MLSRVGNDMYSAHQANQDDCEIHGQQETEYCVDVWFRSILDEKDTNEAHITCCSKECKAEKNYVDGASQNSFQNRWWDI